MATYPMLKTYIQEKLNDTQYKITYFIPENCNSNVVFTAGKYTIEIRLNPGQTNPSTIFIEQNTTMNLTANSLNYKFEQFDSSGASSRKPSITIGE